MPDLPDPDSWLTEFFEFELCPECGGDVRDHDAIIFMGNWFARCRHPLPDDILDDRITEELERRMERAERGLPIIETD